MKTIEIIEFLSLSRDLPVIDVRTPAEYAQGHIPAAQNLPLFSNEERAIIGTTYTQVGRNEAVRQGLNFVGPRMAEMVDRANLIARDQNVLVHCWRGGMRSASVAWLLDTAGIPAQTLRDGYKAYRKHVLQFFEKPLPILILGGKTGSGKTEILQELRQLGEQIVDLEALANHRGSAFGGLGLPPQPTSEHFQNMLERTMSVLDLDRRIWLENESSYIGKAGLPEGLWKQMTVAPLLNVEIPLGIRVQRLVKEYGILDPEQIAESIRRIERRMGPQHMKRALQALQAGDIAGTAEILLRYYDKSYVYLLERREKTLQGQLEMDENDPKAAAEKLIQMANALVEIKQ